APDAGREGDRDGAVGGGADRAGARVDQGGSHAVLDGAGRVELLQLQPELGAALGAHPLQPHRGRGPDEVQQTFTLSRGRVHGGRAACYEAGMLRHLVPLALAAALGSGSTCTSETSGSQPDTTRKARDGVSAPAGDEAKCVDAWLEQNHLDQY